MLDPWRPKERLPKHADYNREDELGEASTADEDRWCRENGASCECQVGIGVRSGSVDASIPKNALGAGGTGQVLILRMT